MTVAFVMRQRLTELGYEQRDLACAAAVTESYISQLLTRKKHPPAPHRTDIYDKMETFLQLPPGELAILADLQRQEEVQRKLGNLPTPLLQDMRALILRKCPPDKATYLRAIFEQQPFGELERLVTQKLLDVVKNVAKEELANETWLRIMARLGDHSYEQMRVIVLEFLDADISHVSLEHCVAFLEPLLESWDVDSVTFGMEIVLNRRLVPERLKQFAFVERDPEHPWPAGGGLDGCTDERWYARRLLLPFHFGEPAGDMGMLWLELAGLVKGGNCFGKLPRRQARVPMRKGVERQGRARNDHW